MARWIPANDRDMQDLREQMAELCAIIEEQRRQIARQEEGHAQQQAEIAELRAERARGTSAVQREGRVGRAHRAGRSSSRRALLKWGGAAAAAAMTMVASEQAAHASPAADGDSIIAGQTTTASSQTNLVAASGSHAVTMLVVDNTPGWPDGWGISGHANGIGAGVYGSSFTSTDLYAGGTGRIQQTVQSAVGAPTTGSYNAGEQIRDNKGDLYLCVASGGPGTWKKVTAIPAGKPGGALVFLSKPFRIFDTRPGVAGCPIDPGVPMASAAITTLQITGTPSTLDSTLVVPTGATGIVGDLLAINVNGNSIDGSGQGFLTLQLHSGTATGNSYLHYYLSQIIHNSYVIGLDGSGKLDVGNFGATTNVGLDITGYII